jgi:hypothetical protein
MCLADVHYRSEREAALGTGRTTIERLQLGPEADVGSVTKQPYRQRSPGFLT